VFSVLLSLLLTSLVLVIIALIAYYRLKAKCNKLVRENNDFKTLCDIIQTPIWFKDKNLKFTWVNAFFSLSYDRDRDDIIGLTDRDIALKKLADIYVRDDEYVLASKKAYKYKENEKAGLWYETTKFPLLDLGGELYGIGGVAFNITSIKKSEQMLHNLVHNDYLTGISNRLFLSVEVAKKLAAADEGFYKLAVILIDLDNFKDLNDYNGHVVGDEILKQIAERLKKYASNKNLLLGRFGGDEFIVIIPEVYSDNEIKNTCEDIKEIFKEKFNIYDSSFAIEASMGIGIYPDNSRDYEGLIRHADMALFYAKQHGRNSVVRYSDSIGSANMKRIKIESRLKGAIERQHEFFLHFQPKVSSDGTKVVGLESLLRWNDNELGFVSPGDFIPIAEQSDLIIDIGDWVLRNALLQNLQWKSTYGEMFNIAVNLSVKQIKQPGFFDKLVNLLEELNYPAEYLELELTEGMIMANEFDPRSIFEKVREIGVKVSLDDFGTGYSNLGYLSNFPLDTVKIDRRFVTDVQDIPEKQQIVNAIVQLANSFGLSLIAEGVENIQELNFLKSKGVDVIQGFYFSKPLPPNKVIEFINSVREGNYKISE
jgi:diguanylate cyclase (GGDEF)-like protein